jgi:hypothetical protein
MTTLVLIWGNNRHNKSRIQEVNKELLPVYNSSHIHYYRHRNENIWWNIDIEYESEQLHTYLKTISGDILLFCKSVWCIVTIKAIVEKDIHIKKCIFVWFPLWFRQFHKIPLTEYIPQLTCPILWIQKTNDPAWWFTTIKEKIWSISPTSIYKEIPGDDHDYQEINLLKEIILNDNDR